MPDINIGRKINQWILMYNFGLELFFSNLVDMEMEEIKLL